VHRCFGRDPVIADFELPHLARMALPLNLRPAGERVTSRPFTPPPRFPVS
jgi:hypothetical protein